MVFENPWSLLLLLFMPALWLWALRPRSKPAVLPYSDLSLPKALLAAQHGGARRWLKRHASPILRSIFLLCCTLALANPQPASNRREVENNGIDIVMVIDTSGSMRALDLQIDNTPADRLSVVKHVIAQFVEARDADRIGLVVFGDGAFTQAPLTSDHSILLQLLDYVKIGMVGENTAIGDAIAVGVNRVKDVAGKSKVIVLLTDGENTAGTAEPMQAAEAAAAYGVRVYTIGVGREGEVPFPGVGIFGGQTIQYVQSHLDEALLKKIAERTGAAFYRAKDTESLQAIYKDIDKLEKAKAKQLQTTPRLETNEHWLMSALLALCIEVGLALTGLRRMP